MVDCVANNSILLSLAHVFDGRRALARLAITVAEYPALEVGGHEAAAVFLSLAELIHVREVPASYLFSNQPLILVCCFRNALRFH